MAQQSYINRGNVAFAIIALLLLFLITFQLLQTIQTDPLDNGLPTTRVETEQGGPTIITGTVSYDDSLFLQGVSSPLVLLEDQAGFIDRDSSFIIPIKSQTLGQITSDFHISPFSYTLSLPMEPQGTLRDVDQDGQGDVGIMLFAIAYWSNIFGDSFLEQRDQRGTHLAKNQDYNDQNSMSGGWSRAYVSTRISQEPERAGEVIGGKVIVYAPVADQGFPNDFGPDQLLFTADDPIVILPVGYTIVDLDTKPFTFDRSPHSSIHLQEPALQAIDDFSVLNYSQAFDAMLQKLQQEYAFGDYKQIDWGQKVAEFRPQFVRAEEEANPDLYLEALHNFLRSIPDTQLGSDTLMDRFSGQIAGGIGIGLTELNDGRIIVSHLSTDGPASRAGVRSGAEVLQVNRKNVADVLNGIIPWSGLASTEQQTRLEKLRGLMRFPLDTLVNLTYRNPGGVLANATLMTVDEQESLNYAYPNATRTDFELPLIFYLLPDGYGYVKIYSFADHPQLTLLLWERLLLKLRAYQVPGLILDMRQNSGGDSYLADQMSAYFFDEPLELGQIAYYDNLTGQFEIAEGQSKQHYLPPHSYRYAGELTAIIGPDCLNACELFLHNLTITQRAQLVGHQTTGGVGSQQSQFLMPEVQSVQYPAARAMNMENQIHIEGQGIAPTILVPQTEAVALSKYDVLLYTALGHLKGDIVPGIVDATLLISDGAIEQPQASTEAFVTGILPTEALPLPQNLVPLIEPAELTLAFATVDTPGRVLNIRSAPTVDSEILGTVPHRSTHLVLETTQQDQWLRISAPSLLKNDAKSGWVSAEFARYRGP